MTIDAYRRRFVLFEKEYIVYVPPIKPITILIEEKSVENTDNLVDKKYVLKRSKPLVKSRSVISSMKIQVDNDDE